jgi:hypothetical protein
MIKAMEYTASKLYLFKWQSKIYIKTLEVDL